MNWQGKYPSFGSALGDRAIANRGCALLEVRGRLVASRQRYILDNYGGKMLQRIADEVRPRTASLLNNPPLAFSWVPFEQLVEIDLHILELGMGGSESSMTQFGADIARYDMPATFSMWARLLSPRFVVSKFDFMMRTYLRPAGIDVIALEDNRTTVQLRDCWMPRYLCARGSVGFLRAVMEWAGGQNVACLHTQCRHNGDAACHYEITWR